MKKQTLKLTALALAAVLAAAPQSAFAAGTSAKSEAEILTAAEKTALYEATAVHYIYDENAQTPEDPGRKSRFQLGDDGVYVNPKAKDTGKATLMITGDLMCQWRQQEAAFTSDGSDYIDIDDIRKIKAEEQARLDRIEAELMDTISSPSTDETADTAEEPAEKPAEEPSEEPDSADAEDISAVPAMPDDKPVSLPAPNFGVIPQPKGEWDFDESFQYVRKILNKGDLVIGNLETMLSQSSPLTMQCYTLEGRPYLNSPVQFLDGIDYAGYDLLTLANNHNCDVGVRGLLETLENIDRYNFLRTGAFADENEDRYLVVDVNGIKVGIVSYASYYNTKDANFTDEGQEVLLNRYFTDKARADIKAARKAGAEYVIAFMHWGAENTHEPTYLQQRNAYNVARAGADYIVGSHPHAIQPFDIVTTGTGKEVPVIYSMGNFLSCMQLDVNNDSLILQLNLERNDEGEVVLASHRLHPCTIMHDLEITSALGTVRTDSYVVAPHNEKFGPGAAMAGKSDASREDLQYMAESLMRHQMVFENRFVLPLPYDPYNLKLKIKPDDSKLQTEGYVLSRIRWVLANKTV